MQSQGIDYTSSEHSLFGDENLYRKPLQWLKQKHRKSLHDLDKLYINQLSQKTKVMKMRNREDGIRSEQPKPENAPNYLRIDDEQCTAAGALTVSSETENGSDLQQ